MGDSFTQPTFETFFSLRPLIDYWEKVVLQGRDGHVKFFQSLIKEIQDTGELTAPVRDSRILEKHQKLVEKIMATIFPVTMSESENLFAACLPCTFDTIYSSSLFRKMILGDSRQIELPHNETGQQLEADRRAIAFQLILKKFYGVPVGEIFTSVYPYDCPETGLDRYMEVEIDTRFIDVSTSLSQLPPLPEDCMNCRRLSDLVQHPEVMSWLSLDKFTFEGVGLIQIREVTQREVMNKIQTSLLTMQSFTDLSTFRTLQAQIENLMGIPGVKFGITPFFEVNGHSVFSEIHDASSLLLAGIASPKEKTSLIRSLKKLFSSPESLLVLPEITPETSAEYPFVETLFRYGWKGAIIYPLFYDKQLIGTLEIVSEQSGQLNRGVVYKIETAIPLFELALHKSGEILDAQVVKVIREQFTAVQSSVQWKFTEAALNYIVKANKDEDAKIDQITFPGVYPLYGAIDIRNSSVERNHAIQKDMLEQLEAAGKIIRKASMERHFPLLDEMGYKVKKYIHSVSNIVLSDDEISINQFLKREVVELFEHLRQIVPAVSGDIYEYFSSIDPHVDMLYRHRKHYDESITFINRTVSRFIDKEQQRAQQIFPHYFERFVTDGVDFNIYIGQSIQPDLPFDDFYVKNLKLWQLSTLARAAWLTRKLEDKVPVPLQTTQLILAHSFPISISFRPAERKFDVDGAYNMRYEIVKKRIDKVRIKETNERLTQPGTIAIVYSQPSEANEYTEYIEFLQSQGLFTGETEKYELEELQGVSGLKALRVQINFEQHGLPEERESRYFKQEPSSLLKLESDTHERK